MAFTKEQCGEVCLRIGYSVNKMLLRMHAYVKATAVAFAHNGFLLKGFGK